MAISGINNYGYNSYQYQSTMNLLGLSSATSTAKAIEAAKKIAETQSSEASDTSKTSKTSSSSSAKSTFSSTQTFLTGYQSALTGLESAAAKLSYNSSKNVFTDYQAASTDVNVATVKGNWRLNSDTDMKLDVHSMAQAQKNVSESHYSQERVEPGADVALQIEGPKGLKADISVSSMNANGSAKTYQQMYQDVAKQINEHSDLGVKASVENVNGKVSLVLTAKDTGAANSFTVSGKTGAADGIQNEALAAQDAVYTVTEKGHSETYTSSSNSISLDYGRIDAQITGVGETQVFTGVDEDEVVSAVRDLMDSYNSVVSILESNSGRGTGAAEHLAAFKRGMADEKTLKALGITYDKNGKMQLDEDKLKEKLETDYDWARETIGGQFGIAEKAASRANSALSDSVQSIVNKDLESATGQNSSSVSGSTSGLSSSLGSNAITSSDFQYFASFVRSGAYNLTNYYMVGMLFNSLA